MVDAEVNTGSLKVDTLEDELVLDSNGEMRPNFNETMVEISVSHDVKTWEDILNIIDKKLGMRALGRPWIANTGRHFKTIGFRTPKLEYENWRKSTYNWQELGVRAITSSRLYR